MNNWVGIGNISKDPVVKYSAAGMCYSSMSVAIQRPTKDKFADFIPVKAFDKVAESVEKYGAKGRLVAVEGRIQTGSYTNKEGRKVYTVEVVAHNIRFLDKSKPDNAPSQEDMESAIPEGFTQLLNDDGIPF